MICQRCGRLERQSNLDGSVKEPRIGPNVVAIICSRCVLIGVIGEKGNKKKDKKEEEREGT